MPSLTFVLPHWMYWAGLIVFPLAAMYIVRHRPRQRGRGGVSLPIAYLLWLTGGFVGIHRLYLRNLWGLVYIPLFIAILWSNVQTREARQEVSNFRNELTSAEFLLERAQSQQAEGLEGAAEEVEQQSAALEQAREQLKAAKAHHERWNDITSGIALAILALLLLDAVLLPRMTRRQGEREAPGAEAAYEFEEEPPPRGTHEDPALKVHTPVTDVIDTISGYAGEFVCYWSLIAVFVYYYEVLARYVFNSPTNWAHEGMFLMFGMQYLISGAFAYREDAHVRVDVIYLRFPERMKVIVDILTSVFFFLFAGALFWTGVTFAWDAIQVWEVSFTEWAIQYWPVKITIPLGGLLIFLQGVSKLIKDIHLLTAKEA